MRKNPRYDIDRKSYIKDVIVVIITLLALAALVFLVKDSNDRFKMEQDQLAMTGRVFNKRVASTLSELTGALVINEVNQDGWIELYNKDKNADITMANCYITVNSNKKYTFSVSDVIGAGEFLCIEGLGRLGTTEHDIIGIHDENGENLKNIMLPSLEKDESYGCKMDGDISYCYLTQSKEKTNIDSSVVIKDRLTFSVPGGFYEDSFQLEITAPEGMTIYYTLDGSVPTSSSYQYEEPILIENKSGSKMQYANAEGINYIGSYRPSSISIGMVVRAIAVDRNGISNEAKAQSYFVGLKNASDIKNIPVISIITAPENLFDYFDGIYVSGRSYEEALARGEAAGEAANFLNGWEKEVYVEYFESQKDKTYEGEMLISIIEDVSVMSPQKSMLLVAEGGAYPGSSLVNYYNHISNKLMIQTNRRDNNYKIREYLAAKLLANTTVGVADMVPCNVFINGEYWGGYMLKALYDEEYIKTLYDVDEDVLIAKNGRITNKSGYQQEYDELYNFIVENDLKDAENYAWVKAHLDIQNYLEYFCANMYLANAEYGMDQLVMWRTVQETETGYKDGKWRFLMPRLDNTMKNMEAGMVATSSINTFLQEGACKDIFFGPLLRNDSFKAQFKSVMSKMANEVFSDEQVESAISDISKQMKKMVENSYKRYFGYPADFFYSKEADKIVSFFTQRKKYILRYTDEVISQGGFGNDGDDAISE